MCRLTLKITGQVDDCDGIKWTFLESMQSNIVAFAHIFTYIITFTHIPHPIHSDSDMVAILS